MQSDFRLIHREHFGMRKSHLSFDLAQAAQDLRRVMGILEYRARWLCENAWFVMTEGWRWRCSTSHLGEGFYGRNPDTR